MHTATIDAIVRRALDEDLPDITTNAIFGEAERGRARFAMKERGVVAGLPFARRVFELLDPEAAFVEKVVEDGSAVEPGTVIAVVSATVRTLLSGERTALNLLQRASGIATTTRRFVDAVAGTAAGIYDTRKTAPGLRGLDKYAVATGGGRNHRIGLFDMFLLKNNHIDRAAGVHAAVTRVRSASRPEKIMIEVRTLEELDEAAAENPDLILLDNMDLDTMREAVRRVGGRIPLEASGGVTLETVRDIAETGVQRISVGALTHSVAAIDIAMRIEAGSRG